MISFEETITIVLEDEECYESAMEEWENDVMEAWKNDTPTQEELSNFEQWLKQKNFVENWLMSREGAWLGLNYEVAQEYCPSKSIEKLEQAVIERYQQDHKERTGHYGNQM